MLLSYQGLDAHFTEKPINFSIMNYIRYMFNHTTESPDVLMYIDQIYLADNFVKVKGWIAHKSCLIKQVSIGGVPIPTVLTSRPDVLGVYPTLPSDRVGVEFVVGKGDIKKRLGIILDSSEDLYVGTLERWYIKSSGFKNLNSYLTVVENFYADPDAVRDFAINNLSFAPSGYHKGQRSARFILDGTKEKFEKILGRSIINWTHPGYANGAFQFCTPSDPIVYHVDSQMFAGIVFLTPDAPLRSGTGTYKSRLTGATRFENEEMNSEKYAKTFKAEGTEFNFYDNSTLDFVDKIANVYNRLVIWDAKAIHAAESYFGDSIENSRFFHLFFFDIE
jgi:hypothetical protein